MDKKKAVRRLIKISIEEDLGRGDITTESVFHEDFKVQAILTVKENAVLCGIEVFKEVFSMISEDCRLDFNFKDGDFVSKGDVICRVECSLKTMMSAERTSLNFLQHLSGIATLTRKFVEKAGRPVVYDTRKTLPALRSLEKYAVRVGGGKNHREGLYDMVLIKDNHIAAFMSKNGLSGRDEAICSMVSKAKKAVKKNCKVEVEVENFAEAEQAFLSGADIVMFDNAQKRDVMEFAEFLGPERNKIQIEWSGNVSLENIGDLSSLPLDRISVGALTHSAKSIDFSLNLNRKKCT